jgi:predicted CopG family antitoxin
VSECSGEYCTHPECRYGEVSVSDVMRRLAEVIPEQKLAIMNRAQRREHAKELRRTARAERRAGRS